MNVNIPKLSYQELYGILLNSVAPRPIAWVSTVNAAGRPNLAPFSFFNCVCVDPPLLAFAPGLRARKSDGASWQNHGEPKDTLRNVRETKEFVVNVVTYELLEKINATSGEYDPSVNEFELAKVTPVSSKVVKPPRSPHSSRRVSTKGCLPIWLEPPA